MGGAHAEVTAINKAGNKANDAELYTTLEPCAHIHHRKIGRPFIVLKLATSIDGKIASADGSSKWITGEETRFDVHRLRAQSDAVMVVSGTVRKDNPLLTVRDCITPKGVSADDVQPLIIVLGKAFDHSRVHPCKEMSGDLYISLDELGEQGLLQVLAEGGATLAVNFYRQGLVDSYLICMSLAIFGGGDALSMSKGPGANNIEDIWRGQTV